MTLPTACCTLLPVSSEYEPQGRMIKIGDLDVYETKDTTPKRLIVCIYDIFGFHNVTKQAADILATAGFRVVMPDFFRGVEFPVELLGKGRPAIMEWIQEHGSWEKTVKKDLQDVLDFYKKDNISAFGVYGMCWGGRRSLDALIALDDIQAAGLVHPSMVENEEANKVTKPILLLPTKDEPDMVPFYEIVKKNLGEENCGHRRFDEIFHGFAGARGDLTNELNRKLLDEAIGLLQNFFRKHVKVPGDGGDNSCQKCST